MIKKTRCSGTMTEAGFRNWVIALLRKGTFRWRPRGEAKINARLMEKLPNDKGRLVYHATCANCEKAVPESKCVVDHIDPVVDPEVGFVDWETYIDRMFCEADNFQILCKPCHDIKTKDEAKRRRR